MHFRGTSEDSQYALLPPINTGLNIIYNLNNEKLSFNCKVVILKLNDLNCKQIEMDNDLLKFQIKFNRKTLFDEKQQIKL